MRLEGHGGWAVEGVLACASVGHGKRTAEAWDTGKSWRD